MRTRTSRLVTSDSIAQAIGNTPLVRLKNLGKPANRTLLGKCEFMNPGGSVKDRIAFHMVEKAEEEGILKPGQLMVEATGGNTGIGLALAARLKGYKLLCVVSDKVGREKVDVMQALGAEVLTIYGSKAVDDPDHFKNKSISLAKERDGWYVGQFENKYNVEAHYNSTGPEIWEQTEGKIDALIAGIGTGGTIIGAGKYLKEKNPKIKIVAADPYGSKHSELFGGAPPGQDSYLIEGIGGDELPPIVDKSVIDEVIQVSDQDSIRMTHRLVEREGLFVSGSAGCFVSAATRYCESSLPEGSTAVAILPGTGRYYMNTIFNDKWLAENNISLDDDD